MTETSDEMVWSGIKGLNQIGLIGEGEIVKMIENVLRL